MAMRPTNPPRLDNRVYEQLSPLSEWKKEEEADILLVFLPGFVKANIRVTTETKNIISVFGERLVAGNKWNCFQEDFQIPENCNIRGIRTKLERGILTITMPCKAKVKTTQTTPAPAPTATLTPRPQEVSAKPWSEANAKLSSQANADPSQAVSSTSNTKKADSTSSQAMSTAKPVNSPNFTISIGAYKSTESISLELPRSQNVKDDKTRRSVDESLYHLLPMLPLLHAFFRQDFNWISWAYKRCTDIRVVALNYPSQIKFARRKITDGSETDLSAGTFQRFVYINPHFLEKGQLPSQPNKYTPNFTIVESQYSTIGANTVQTPSLIHSLIVESPNSPIVDCPNPEPDTPQPVNKDLPFSSQTIPSTSNPNIYTNLILPGGDSFFERINMDDREDIEAALNKLFLRLSFIPSKTQFARMLEDVVKECSAGFENTDEGVKQSFIHVAKEASRVPYNIFDKFSKSMKDFADIIKDNLKNRDEIYLEEIKKHSRAIEILQDTNVKSIKFLSDKVFDMSKGNIELKEIVTKYLERKDTAMTLVNRERADKKYEDLSRKVTLTKQQLEEMVKTIKDLTEEVNELRKDARCQKGREESST